MKININKTKTMVIGRKPKIEVRIKDEFVEQVGSFKYLVCNINSNMNCCQEVKQRISMAKDTFNRKRSIFCSFSNLSVTSVTSQLILQPFRRFTYVTAHSPSLPLLHLRHSSFSSPSFASPTSQALHLIQLASRSCYFRTLRIRCIKIINFLN